MAELDHDAAAAALEGAFGNAPAPKPAPAPVAAPAPVQDAAPLLPEVDEDERTDLEKLTDGVDPEAKPVEVAEPEAEFTIEVDGKPEVVAGTERVKELLTRGLKAGRQSEENARVRDQLVQQAQMMEQSGKFQAEVLGDLAELRALDARLEEFNRVDWSSAIDTDFVQAMKLQQQRSALKEVRDQKVAALSQKQQQFVQGQQQAVAKLRAAEEAALLAKLPEWRNNERASAEKTAIVKVMQSVGYQEGEIANLMDHRAVLLARDAMKWRELQKTSAEKVKQVRDAPPVVKPGAATQQADPNSKAGFQKFTHEFRKQGRAGNHRAQEAALEKVLARTFK